jgi:hypothetical protein
VTRCSPPGSLSTDNVTLTRSSLLSSLIY